MLRRSHWRMKVSTVWSLLRHTDYSLRDYGTAHWEGGDPECDHTTAKIKSRYDYAMQPGTRHAELAKTSPGTDAQRWKDVCPTCGARKIDNQIGLERDVNEYVD